MSEYIVQEVSSPVGTEKETTGVEIKREVIGELIQCKDCKWFYEGKWCLRFMYALLPEDYCSNARRREE